AYLGVLLTGLVLYLVKTGVRQPELYPRREKSPYLLPWPGGLTWTCTQGNWGVLTHRKHDVYHFDFPMPIGSPVCAARDGVVETVIDEHDGNENPLLGGDVSDVPGNGIFIRHADGTVAVYWHIRKESSRVRKGQRVKQGDVIAESGNVGFSTSPHL